MILLLTFNYAEGRLTGRQLIGEVGLVGKNYLCAL